MATEPSEGGQQAGAGSSVDIHPPKDVVSSITESILKEIQAVKFQNAQLRKAMKEAGLTPPSEDANFEAFFDAVKENEEREATIDARESVIKAAAYKDAADYALAAKRRGDIRWNEACDTIRRDLLAVSDEFVPK